VLLRLLSVAAVGFFLAATAHAAEPLVDGKWAVQNVAAPNVVFIDVQSTRNYQRRHIPGSIHTDYPDEGWRFFTDELGVVLPSRVEFSRLVGGLGIENENHIVLVATGASDRDMSIATDVYWTFKYFGHAEISILDGGLRAYRSARGKVENGAGTNRPATEYTSRRRSRYLAEYDDVFGALGVSVLVDHRSYANYLGINKANVTKTYGAIPGTRHLPADWLMRDGGGRFRSTDQLLRLFRHAGVRTEGGVISIGDSSLEGSLGWFVMSEILGNRGAKLYTGGMAQWSRRGDNPMVRRVDLDAEDN
jgi:thiosulfate/3-mercaptopyruvate sulfurtransferase